MEALSASEQALLHLMDMYGDAVLRACVFCMGDGRAAHVAAQRIFLRAYRHMPPAPGEAAMLQRTFDEIRRALGPLRWRLSMRRPDAFVRLSPERLAALYASVVLPEEQAAWAMRMTAKKYKRQLSKSRRAVPI